ncbi:hypothetical protein F2Q70_00022468 [Brassica cretica]|uniref:Uncharacterized protein n=1 Tax=Brassica cretica TaxID=69181 RepID=A0A8S9GU64_BRACR|nr:hypothetical protein F2Q70_00022468 [Brassica cretica]
MSFGGSHWCRPMSMDTHRSTDHDEDRSTDYSKHRSTSSAESTAECSAVRIMTHEEFAEKHPHPPSPFYVKIDRPHEPAVDRQRETDIDRPPSPPIDRRAPLTYRVRLPSIDNDRINALRPPPKPLANPPEPTTNPSDTTPEPMQSESIDTHTASSIDSTESSIDSTESPTTDEHYPMSLDGKYPVDHFTLPDQWYPNFAFQQPNKRGRGDYSIGSWADSGFYESFAVETVIPSSNEDPTEEYDEDYWKKRAIEIAMQDDRYSSHSFNNTSPPSIDRIYSASVDTHPHPAKRSYASIDTTPGTSIDIKAAALKKEKGNIPIPSRFTNTYIRSFAPQITYHDTEAEKMNALTNQSEGTSRKSIRSKNPNSADKRLPSIDTPVSTSIDSHSKPKLSLFTKKVLRIPVEKPFDEVYYTHRLWMFFRETKETEEDIRRMFHHVRERMKLRITLKKKSDPGKFAIPCVSPTTDEHYPTSLDWNQPIDHFTLPDHCYTDFAFQQPNKRGCDDYSIGCWADSGFHESFAVETVIPSSNEYPTEEYDEDYWKKRSIEIAMQDERYSSHSFNNTSPPSIDRVYSASVDTHPHPVKQSYALIDTTQGTSIDIKVAAFEK